MILSSTRSISAFARASGSFPPRDFPRRADGGRLPPRLIRGGCDTNTLDSDSGPPPPAPRVARQPPILTLEIEQRGSHAAQMREVRDTVARADQRQHEIQRDEKRDEPFGWHRVRQRKDEHRMVRPIPGEGDRNAQHGTRRADDLGDGYQLPQDEGRRRATDPAEEIEEDEHATTHAVFDRRAEDEQHEHVEQDVRNARVQEHVRDERPRILPGMRGREPERADKARRGQPRALNKENEQVGDEESSYPGSQTVHPLRAHLCSYVSLEASSFYPPFPVLLFRARLAIRSHSSGKGMPDACAA